MNSILLAVTILSASCLLNKAAVHAKKQLVKNINEVHDGPFEGGLRNLRSRSSGNLNSASRASTNMKEESRDLILSGTEIQQNDYPYLAYLNITSSNGNTKFCGGTLIDPNWILTAAQCVDEALSITAWLGMHNISTIGSNFTTDSGIESHLVYKNDIHINPQYDKRNIEGDFALIYLQDASSKTPPIVNYNISKPGEKDVLWAVGWGQSDYYDYYYSSDVPLETSLEVVGQDACKLSFADFGDGAITNDMICATGWGAAAPCFGDEGGPLVIKDPNGDPSKDSLVGVTSWFSSDGCAAANRPSVFGNVFAAYIWIRTTLGKV